MVLSKKLTLGLLALLLLWQAFQATEVYASEFTGVVTGVLNGDTIEVQSDRDPVRVKLFGIECPDPHQPFGPTARYFTSTMLLGRQVSVTVDGSQPDGTVLGSVALESGMSVNHELVRSGLAWWNRLMAPGDNSLWKLEYDARIERRGLWSDADPIAPWEWRKGF